MARLFIGIDIDAGNLRMVSLAENGGDLQPVALTQRQLAPGADVAEVVESIASGWEASGARMALALPAAKCLARHLVFPFADRRKIAAAVPLELDSRLPADLDTCFVTAMAPVAHEERFHTVGLAVPHDLISSTLEPFDQRLLPLRLLGVAPFAYSGLLRGKDESGILLCVRSAEISSLLLKDGRPAAHRTSLRRSDASPEETVALIRRDVLSLQKAADNGALPVWMFGAGLDAGLQRAITAALPNARVPEEQADGERIPAEFLAALALGRLAAEPGPACNLRQGKYAFRGSLAPFRKQLIAAGILLAIALGAFGAGAWLSYSAKTAVADALQAQMAGIYSQTFPDAGAPPKDIPLHMTSRLNAARSQSELLGGPGVAPLAVLEAISRSFPEGNSTVIRELNYDKEGVRIAGQSTSFEAVDQLAAALKREPSFGGIQISDAKTNIDGKRVDFRVDLDYAGTGGNQ